MIICIRTERYLLILEVIDIIEIIIMYQLDQLHNKTLRTSPVF